jgi:hypothetical protein
MSPEADELAEWSRGKRADAVRQIDLFTAGGVKALLLMPNGAMQDITAGVIAHQREAATMFERIIAALT